MEHSPEPWRLLGKPMQTAGNTWLQPLLALPDEEMHLDLQPATALGCTLKQAAANARRIVACVNACKGIPTEVLESGGIHGFSPYE